MLGGWVDYDGEVCIDGVLGQYVVVFLMFENFVGFMMGMFLFMGNVVDVVCGVDCIMIDNGMFCVVMCVEDFGLIGQES